MTDPDFVDLEIDPETLGALVALPGSAEARGRGCTCPGESPHPGCMRFAYDCPLHIARPERLS